MSPHFQSRNANRLDSLLSSLDPELNDFIYDIQGHTDSIGNRLYNLELSEKKM